MAYNTQAIKTDVNGKPIPQYYDALHDEYRPLQGEHGASRAVLYGPDGQPIGTQERPLETRVRELESLIGSLVTDPDELTVLGRLKAILEKLPASPATSDGQTVIAQAIEELSGIVATQQTLAQAVTQLTNIVNKLNSTLTVDGKVELKGRMVTVGSTQYRVLPDGLTLVGPAAQRPTVANAVAALGRGVRYWAEDTGDYAVANSVDGTWRSVGVI